MELRKLLIIPVVILLILIIGTIGYHVVEPRITLFESFYITAINITTLGYADVKPLTTAGRLFNLIIILLAWVGIFISARITGQLFIEGEITKLFGRRKMEKQLSSITGHHIVCGYGRVGRVVCDNFAAHKTSFVVVERNDEAVRDIKGKGYLYVHGDCTEDESLIGAGIERARGLINAIANDADAVYVTLSARQHNPDIFIMARSDSPDAEQKLKRAGADRVISPHAAAGIRMAMSALRPNVVDFISLATGSDKDGVRVEEIMVPDGSAVGGKSFKEIEIRARYGLNIIGVKKPDGKVIFNPTADYVIDSGDTLIMVGSAVQLSGVDELLRKGY